MQRMIITSLLLFLEAFSNCSATRFSSSRSLSMPGEKKEALAKEEPAKVPSMAPSIGSLADFYQQDSWNFGMPHSSAVHFAAGRLGANPHPPIDKEGYEKDWANEYKVKRYPKEAEGKMHHPEYTEPKKSAASGSATPLGSLLLLSLGFLCFAK